MRFQHPSESRCRQAPSFTPGTHSRGIQALPPFLLSRLDRWILILWRCRAHPFLAVFIGSAQTTRREVETEIGPLTLCRAVCTPVLHQRPPHECCVFRSVVNPLPQQAQIPHTSSVHVSMSDGMRLHHHPPDTQMDRPLLLSTCTHQKENSISDYRSTS